MTDLSRTGTPVTVVLRDEVVPPVVLPMPAFDTYDAAADYARGMFARTHYLESQLVVLSDRVSQAQIDLSAAEAELAELLVAARQLLVVGKALA